MITEPAQETAISEVVGEMLMIAVVLILLAVFSSSLSNYMPSERSPKVEIKVCHDTNSITFWHKGGDWIKTDSLRVVVVPYPNGNSVSYRRSEPNYPINVSYKGQAFDLGDSISVTPVKRLEETDNVTLATDRAVIYSGNIGGDCP